MKVSAARLVADFAWHRHHVHRMDNKESKTGEALKRDWEQTKHDFNKKAGEELNQDVGDTVGQATGKKPIPPPSVPNSELDKK
jgi:hypothetical protein